MTIWYNTPIVPEDTSERMAAVEVLFSTLEANDHEILEHFGRREDSFKVFRALNNSRGISPIVMYCNHAFSCTDTQMFRSLKLGKDRYVLGLILIN